ncbi:hypothetical protein L1280_000534 [Deinococcus sp. HSC-46F16]|uniref:hypothetical protein n=1 Tax=Deinococcus sp. HSC-46F16 TaxID=2910968 RepID=UPI00209FCCBA|nr:hypothetical protein [Deinococcus sp. HSC-46F16]MCP2013406.1 hypothetical protein [Deinococcus sp. HSC-46F16]
MFRRHTLLLLALATVPIAEAGLAPRLAIENLMIHLKSFRRDPIGPHCRQVEQELRAQTYPINRAARLKFIAAVEYVGHDDITEYPALLDAYTKPFSYSLTPLEPWKGQRRLYEGTLIGKPYLYTLDYQDMPTFEPDISVRGVSLCFIITAQR